MATDELVNALRLCEIDTDEATIRALVDKGTCVCMPPRTTTSLTAKLSLPPFLPPTEQEKIDPYLELDKGRSIVYLTPGGARQYRKKVRTCSRNRPTCKCLALQITHSRIYLPPRHTYHTGQAPRREDSQRGEELGSGTCVLVCVCVSVCVCVCV